VSPIRALALFALLAACRIATIRPIESETGKATVAVGAFDATAYVESIWESRALPTVDKEGVEATLLVQTLQTDPADAVRRFGRPARGSVYYLVAGSGVVVSWDSTSRNGLLGVDLVGDARADLWILVGPVVQGMALRDALGFITFDQFVNQVDYADAGNALNQRVLDAVLKGLDFKGLQGRRVAFAGALAAGERLLLTPTRLEAKTD
jgi:predicted lipoprotein